MSSLKFMFGALTAFTIAMSSPAQSDPWKAEDGRRWSRDSHHSYYHHKKRPDRHAWHGQGCCRYEYRFDRHGSRQDRHFRRPHSYILLLPPRPFVHGGVGVRRYKHHYGPGYRLRGADSWHQHPGAWSYPWR